MEVSERPSNKSDGSVEAGPAHNCAHPRYLVSVVNLELGWLRICQQICRVKAVVEEETRLNILTCVWTPRGEKIQEHF